MIRFKNMRLNAYCGLAAAVFAFTACADWDDHYAAETSLMPSQKATLWENIDNNARLGQFAELLKKVGYDSVLSASQTYTVWAPVDNTFDYATVSKLNDQRLLKEFVQNHIARNNYTASGSIEKRLYMLNEKLMHFSSSATSASGYDMEGIKVDSANLACSNGVIHTIDGLLPFARNIYEALDTNSNSSISAVSRFFYSYDVKKLNESKSVQGPTLNGQVTYLDSVFDRHNDLFARYDAYINCEDSNYTMLVPTNEAWEKAQNTIRKYYNYLPSFQFMENTSLDEVPDKIKEVTVADPQYLQDSVVNMLLTGYLFYNNNVYDNKKLSKLQTGQTLQCDSLYGTTFSKIYGEDAALLFKDATRTNMSNGAIWVTDSLRMRTWTCWNPELRIQAENARVQASTVSTAGDPERIYVAPGTQNPDVPGHLSSNAYAEIQPVSMSVNPGVVFYLPNVRSTTYSIYMVIVPGNYVAKGLENKPNRFKVSMGYADSTGVNVDNDASWVAQKEFTSDTTKIDTIYLGDFTFPIAYVGTGSYYPYLRVNSYVSSSQRKNFDRTLRIDCIILRPKELDVYKKEHPEYQYDNGLY